MAELIIRFGLPGLIRVIIAECYKRHKHYEPSESVFSAWARVLERHLPEMEREVRELYR